MSKFEMYVEANYSLPKDNWGWNLYGAGLENFGKDGKPEAFPVPEPSDDQMLVRVDSVGICFSDIKILKQGRKHPKLYNRDLKKEPGRLGHEVSLTIIKVGKNLQADFKQGQRYAVQPDVYQNGMSTAYGYTIPGGLIQYHLIGREMLETDTGVCLLPLKGEISYGAASLLEPWGCVLAAYTQRRRLEPKPGGNMWIVGCKGDERVYRFSKGLDTPELIVLTDVPEEIRKQADATSAKVIVRDGLTLDDYAAVSEEWTEGAGFDDIVVLDPRSADAVAAISRLVARRGTMNLVGKTPLDGLVGVDVGRLHYDYIALLGNPGPDIADSYGEAHNRCELKPQGTAVFIGAGGPMGQMHVQRALEMPDGPQVLVATEISQERLDALKTQFQSLAAEKGREIYIINPMDVKPSLNDFVKELTGGKGADDVVVSVPVGPVMSEAAGLMNEDGMFVAFAGMPVGTLAPVNMSNIYLHRAQFTGTSGLTFQDQKAVLDRSNEGQLSPGRMVAAIGGIETASKALQGVMDGRFPGKIVVFPQIHDLPLMGLDELAEKLPEVAEKLSPGNVWTVEAEAALIEKCWQNE